MVDQSLNEYYARTADAYDRMHVSEDDEHYTALRLTMPYVRLHGIRSVLDVGCGTGRALTWYDRVLHEPHLCGLDPCKELLAKAQDRPPHARLVVGTGEQMPFKSGEFDLVLATGIMHHVDDPGGCIREMFRVARRAVLVSDHNNFAFGGRFARRLRLGLKSIGLLGVFTFIRNGFRRKGYTEDGNISAE